jgi:mannose/fructose/N-acetylgalactosamine-specific phosphotransferase system component IID
MEVFNTTVAPSTFIMGLSVAMEEKNAKDKNFDPKAISAVKMALMGPIAGIGDSFFWGVFRVIAAGIGVSFALKGSILGPIIFLILYNIPHFLVRYYGLFLGYEKGNSFLRSMNDTGKMELITYCAGILGVLVIGSMVGTMVTIKTPLVLNLQGAKVNFQQIFDQILPQALPLGATLLTYSLLKKRVNINYIMLGIFAIGIIGSLIGIL